MSLPLFEYVGWVYRAHDPRWAFSPESGAGAARDGARFNSPGMPALYTGCTMEGAWAEAQQGFPGRAQPLTLCCYEVACEGVLDLTSESGRKAAGTTMDVLECPWAYIRDIEKREPPTWALVRRLRAAGVAAIMVPSFARFAPRGATNLVFYDWNHDPPHRVQVIDDHSRLPKNQDSWPPDPHR